MKKPLIAILPRCEEDPENKRSFQYVFDGVRTSIIKKNGIPFILTPPNDLDYYHTKWNNFPEFTDEEKAFVKKQLDMCDGLLIPGGYKLTKYDMLVIELATNKNMPILGICLGMQSLASYNKEVELKKIESSINHLQDDKDKYCHKIKIKKNTLLEKIFNSNEIMVNSFHRMTAMPNDLFKTSAVAEDGVIEAIEMEGKSFVLGVQWHPEKMLDYDLHANKLYEYFINECINYHKNKKENVVKL